MFQVSIARNDADGLRAGLRALATDERAASASSVLVSVFTDTAVSTLAEEAVRVVGEELPEALVCGCSMNSGIERGRLEASHALAYCTVFENPATRLELVRCDFEAGGGGEDGMTAAAKRLVAEVAARPWAKLVVLLTTAGPGDLSPFCAGLGALEPDVQVVGGAACDADISDNPGYVVSSVAAEVGAGSAGDVAGLVTRDGAVALVIGGPDVEVSSVRVSGWQPLGRELRVTRCEGTVIHEFNGRPAFEVYSHYLKIDSGSGFYSNALEFPLLFDTDDGMRIPAVPLAAGRAGELRLATTVRKGDIAHIAYGDPESIRREVESAASDFADAGCQGVFAFDCASRRKFWGDGDCSAETLIFDSVAPTMGFYTGGEFYRAPSGLVHFNNTSIVLAGLRENGVASDAAEQRSPVEMRGRWVRRRLSVVHRMANFVNVAVADLEQANARLREVAATDPLTGLLNRGEIQRRIEGTLADAGRDGAPVCLLMLDIDDYKTVNDRFGHHRGDSLLRSLSRLMDDIVGVMAPGASLGRWGGDEFMVLLPDLELPRTREVAEALRRAFAAIDLGAGEVQTLSCGIAQARDGESADSLCTRVDNLLYRAKHEGKNRVCG